MSTTDFHGKVRARDPETSWDAAAEQTEEHVSRVQRSLYSLLVDYGPMTDDELWKEWERHRSWSETLYPQVTQQRLRSARSELRTQGKVIDSGRKGVSPTGRAATIWQASEQ